MRSALLRSPLFPLALLGALLLFHSLAGFLGWYWTIPAVSVLMHFLGGFVVAGIAGWYLTRRGRAGSLAVLLGIAVGVGICWELFEWFLDSGILFTPALPSLLSWGDTLTDIALDGVGALAFWRIFLFSPRPRSPVLLRTLATEGDGE